MHTKKNKIVCVYQDLSKIDADTCEFTNNLNLDFDVKECILRQVTYSQHTANNYDTGNFLIWTSMNNTHLCSVSPSSDYIYTDEKTSIDYYVSQFSESPNTCIFFPQPQRLTDVRFAVYKGIFKPTLQLNGVLCLVLEFR